MTLEQIWEQLCRKQPKLEDGNSKVELTAENLKMLLSQVYEQGQRSVPKNADGTRKSPFDIFSSGLG